MLELIARHHPEANGRSPERGDTQWVIRVPLEDDDMLVLKLGRKDRDILFGMLIADAVDSGEPEPS